ncbi:hypothetical protein [Streptomyces sp. C8S0]|uniref:hypothetical protein n=1 Tax=Streptomyces sp. C8S0 TaxID=2585716 RepID=UPI001D04E874|nr:hypothetical protein [Streptomyces sp. C8S0]
MSDPYLLARARALRTVAVPADRTELTRLRRAVDDVERRLVDIVAAPDGIQELMVGWAADVEPASGAWATATSTAPPRPSAWSPWPAASATAGPTPASRCTGTARPAGGRHRRPDSSPGHPRPRDSAAVLGQTGHFLTALRFLRACGHLAADVSDGMIRLGPKVALWSERDVAELRSGYNVLPAPRKG